MNTKKNIAYFYRRKEAENFQETLKKKVGIDSEISKQTIDNRLVYMVTYVYKR